MSKRKAFLDNMFSKVVSRKFLVFILATLFLTIGFVSADIWASIAMVYIASQGAIDLTEMAKTFLIKDKGGVYEEESM